MVANQASTPVTSWIPADAARFAVVVADAPNYGRIVSIHATAEAAARSTGIGVGRCNYHAIWLDADDADYRVGDRIRWIGRRL